MADEKRIVLGAHRPSGTAAETLSQDALYRLLTWFSPTYPIGAFSYSSGIEWAVEAGDVTSAETLRAWLESILNCGAGINDGILFSQIHRAVGCDDTAAMVEIAELAAAFAPTRERYVETTTMGRAFMEVAQAAWPCAALTKLVALWPGSIAYPVAAGAACAGHCIPLVLALHTFLTALCANWISAGVRLVPLGHTDGQCVLSALEPAVAASTNRALAAHLDDLASATIRADIASARHETQYTRLFRS
jgi:urease accessory protein